MLLLGVACQATSSPSASRASSQVLFALTADHELAQVDLASGRVMGLLRLGRGPSDRFTEHALAAAPDGHSLYVLINGGQRGHDEIVQVALPPTIVNMEDGDHS